MMTNKNKSKQVLKLKYLLLVPALASMLFYVSCQQKKQTFTEQVNQLNKEMLAKDSLSKSEKKAFLDLTLRFIGKARNKPDSTVVEVEEVSDVPFAIIEQPPIYPGCEDAEDKRKCFSENITKLISTNFNSKMAKNLGLKPTKYSKLKGVSLNPYLKRIFVMFKIDKTGQVVDVRARAPHKKLEEEAIRVINLIPKLKPGFDKGKAVAVKYSLPIVFNVPK